MKTVRLFIACCIAVLVLVGCGSSSSSSDSGSTETATITGTLGTGTIAGSVSKSVTPAADYTIVAIDNSTSETYTATTNSDGTFSLAVPANIQYHLSLMTNGSYVGPTVFSGSESEVNTVIKPTADLALGAITVDETNGYAQTDAVPTAVDTTVTAVAVDSKPFGAGPGVNGKDPVDDVTNRSDMDMDQDGIPNLFDADEDNDGYRNGILSIPTDILGTSTVVERVYIASNIWVPHGEVTAGLTHAQYAPTSISMRIMVTPKAGQEDQISSVQCTSVPADIQDIATINTGSTGDAIGYPTEGYWKDYDYNLYKMVTETAGSWIAVIAPNTVMSIGDTFTIRVTYIDSTYEDFFLTTSYILTDWAWITTYDSGATTLTDSEGSRSTPAEFTGSALAIKFSKPKDEDGDYLEGLTYSVIYGVSDYDASSGHWQVADPATRDTIQDSEITDNGDGTLSATIPIATVDTYYITPVAESADGQRNGEETWFTRTE